MKISNLIKKVYMLPIKMYKKYISVWLGHNCRFLPTCSEYASTAIDKYGIIKGSFMAIKRILRCNPFCKGGYDPVK